MAEISKVAVLIESSREYGRGILRGVAQYARLHDPWIFYIEPGDDKISLKQLEGWKGDGIIAVIDNKKLAEKIVALNIPTIARGNFPIPGMPTIDHDCFSKATTAAEHLIGCGLKHFAYCGYSKTYWSAELEKVFDQIIRKAGFDLIIYKSPGLRIRRLGDRGYRHLTDWIKTLPKPIGILACNDDRGHHVIESCKYAHARVPEEVAVIGVDNDELICEFCNPPLTSIKLNTEKAGYRAAELLDLMMKGKKVPEQKIEVIAQYVVPRQSTNILAVEDKAVAEALQFIRSNIRRAIHVEEVAGALAMTQQALNKRFRKALGRSIHDEIQQVRMAHIARMLIETDMPISRIAATLGYYDIKNLSRAFRQMNGMTPKVYRNTYSFKAEV